VGTGRALNDRECSFPNSWPCSSPSGKFDRQDPQQRILPHQQPNSVVVGTINLQTVDEYCRTAEDAEKACKNTAEIYGNQRGSPITITTLTPCVSSVPDDPGRRSGRPGKEGKNVELEPQLLTHHTLSDHWPLPLNIYSPSAAVRGSHTTPVPLFILVHLMPLSNTFPPRPAAESLEHAALKY